MVKNQNCAVWIQYGFHCIHKERCIYKDVAEIVEARFNPSNHESKRSLSKGKIIE